MIVLGLWECNATERTTTIMTTDLTIMIMRIHLKTKFIWMTLIMKMKLKLAINLRMLIQMKAYRLIQMNTVHLMEVTPLIKTIMKLDQQKKVLRGMKNPLQALMETFKMKIWKMC
jgi:hypothetical protein